MATEVRTSLAEARSELAAEWRKIDPQTPEDIDNFYINAHGMSADVEAWHETPERKSWTAMLKHVAEQSKATVAIDIGAGAGHDIAALRSAGVKEVYGVEPNERMRRKLDDVGFKMFASVDDCKKIRSTADLFVCVDVLEHIPNPEAFLERAFGNAKVGAVLFEATATHDIGTPLHLKENRGWQPGRWLEQHGWWLIDEAGGRVHIWEKQREKGIESAHILISAHRLPSCVFPLVRTMTGSGGTQLWRMKANVGDALIARSRSVLVHNWYVNTGDDCFLMIDDDITFDYRDADRAIEYCRQGYDIVCGGYPVRDGTHLALRTFPGTGTISFGPSEMPIEVMYAATGFMAVHRRVIDKMSQTLPLVNSGVPWFRPYFQEIWPYDEVIDGYLWLSEDWGFSHLAREAGFKIWLDPATRLVHEGRTIPLTVANMQEVQNAIAQA